MRTRAPKASRLLFVPDEFEIHKVIAVLPELCSSVGGSPLLDTTISTNPSLSKSAKATPRPARRGREVSHGGLGSLDKFSIGLIVE